MWSSPWPRKTNSRKEPSSMVDAIAITLHQLPQSLGERAAKAFDIQRFVDVLCYALQTTSKLFWGLLPRLGHTVQRFPSPDPGNGSFMEHHLLETPWLMPCVVLVIGFQGMRLCSGSVRSMHAALCPPRWPRLLLSRQETRCPRFQVPRMKF